MGGRATACSESHDDTSPINSWTCLHIAFRNNHSIVTEAQHHEREQSGWVVRVLPIWMDPLESCKRVANGDSNPLQAL